MVNKQKSIPVENIDKKQTEQKKKRDFCSPCNERYCGNCIHANGKVMNY